MHGSGWISNSWLTHGSVTWGWCMDQDGSVTRGCRMDQYGWGKRYVAVISWGKGLRPFPQTPHPRWMIVLVRGRVMQLDVTCPTSAFAWSYIYLLKIPPIQEKRRRASVGAVVKKTRFGKVNVGSILANMMVKFPVKFVYVHLKRTSRFIQCHHIPIQLSATSLVSYTGHFTNMARKRYKELFFYFLHAFRYEMKSKSTSSIHGHGALLVSNLAF